MEIELAKQNDSKLFGRKELEGEISHFNEPTPSRAQLRDLLAAKLNADKLLVSVRQILSTFGGKTKFIAVIYDNKESFEKFEPKFIVKRHPVEAKQEAVAEKAEG